MTFEKSKGEISSVSKGLRNETLCFIYLGTRWRRVVSFNTPQHYYLCGKSLRYLTYTELCGHHSRSGSGSKKRSSLSYWESKPGAVTSLY
jgi:hypothetical protein